MSRKAYFDSRFWSDGFVVDKLDLIATHLFIYLFTNEHTNLAGIYELSLRTMAFEVKLDQEDLPYLLKQLQPKVYYFNGWVVLRSGIKNQNYKNSKINAAILSILETVPPELLEYVNWPKDFGEPKPKGSRQVSLTDSLSMSHDSDMHDSSMAHHIELNRIELNQNKNQNQNAPDSAGFKKTVQTAEQRRTYARAAQADRDQEARAETATARKGTPKSLSELYRERRLNGKEAA